MVPPPVASGAVAFTGPFQLKAGGVATPAAGGPNEKTGGAVVEVVPVPYPNNVGVDFAAPAGGPNGKTGGAAAVEVVPVPSPTHVAPTEGTVGGVPKTNCVAPTPMGPGGAPKVTVGVTCVVWLEVLPGARIPPPKPPKPVPVCC